VHGGVWGLRNIIFIAFFLGQGEEPKIVKSIDQESKPAGAEGKLSCSVANKAFSAVSMSI
jgi:hypothetical protein